MTSNAVTLQSLRSALCDQQQSILDDVWTHVKSTRIGLPERPLLEKYGKLGLRDQLGKLSGTIIYSGHEEDKLRYNLGLVGIFLTSEGHRLEKLVQRYLLILRDAYTNNKDIETFSSNDLANWAPDFTASELNELRLILHRAHGSFASRLGGWNDNEFFVTVENEIVDLKNIDDWGAYIDSQILKSYDSNLPVGDSDRARYSLGSKPNRLFDAINEANKLSFGRRPSNDYEALDLTFFTDDAELRLILENDWKESCVLLRAEAWKSCVLLCGGIIEGILLWQLENFQRRSTVESNGIAPDIRYDGETLSGVLRRSKEFDLVAPDELFLMDWARVYRNIIHPGNQRRESRSVEKSHAELAQKLVQVVADNVRKRVLKV
jgi:hypothetical protein